MLFSKCAVSSNKASKFIREQETSKLLRNKGTFKSNSFSRASYVLEVLAS